MVSRLKEIKKSQATESIEIRKSTLHGRGVFTIESIKKGETVVEIRGSIIRLQKFFKTPQKIRDNMFRLSADEYIDPRGEFGDFQNHSCNPNSRIVKKGKRLYLEAIKDIKRRSEITFDFSTILAKDDFWVMKCRCKTSRCRKYIKQYPLLPKPLLEKYIEEKMIPSYILKIQW